MLPRYSIIIANASNVGRAESKRLRIFVFIPKNHSLLRLLSLVLLIGVIRRCRVTCLFRITQWHGMNNARRVSSVRIGMWACCYVLENAILQEMMIWSYICYLDTNTYDKDNDTYGTSAKMQCRHLCGKLRNHTVLWVARICWWHHL